MPSTDRYSVTINPLPGPVTEGDIVRLEAEPSIPTNVRFLWDVRGAGTLDRVDQESVNWNTRGLPVGTYPVAVTALWEVGGGRTLAHSVEAPVDVRGRAVAASFDAPQRIGGAGAPAG